MSRSWRTLVALLLVTAASAAPTVTVLSGEPPVVAALATGRLHFVEYVGCAVARASLVSSQPRRDVHLPRAEARPTLPGDNLGGERGDLRDIDATGITTLAALSSDLFAARGRELVRLHGDSWSVVCRFDDPIQQLLPAPAGDDELVLLTGTPADPVLADGKVWRLPRGGTTPRRITAIQDGYRPWRLWPAAKGGRPQLGSLCYKATRHWRFEHHTLFVFDWGPRVSAAWLGSALSRPHLDATHADLLGDGEWRLIAVEVTREGGRAVSIYRPLGFGYEGEWRSEPLPELSRVRAFGDRVVLAGGERAWELRYRAGYELVPLSAAPADLDDVARVGDHLIGWSGGAWQSWPLPQ